LDAKTKNPAAIEQQDVIVKNLGFQSDYQTVWKAMRDYTVSRDPESPDQIWFVEHAPVFTQGQAGRPEHLLKPKEMSAEAIPVIQTDRGGQVT